MNADAAGWRRVAVNVSALCSGIIFGIGLALAQMIDPRKVLAFLDVGGDWDPSLLPVLCAVVVTSAGYALLRRRAAPLLDETLYISRRKCPSTARLLSAAALFGVGWGMAGYCPGPAIEFVGFWQFRGVLVRAGAVCGAGLLQQCSAAPAGCGSFRGTGAARLMVASARTTAGPSRSGSIVIRAF